MEEGEVTLHTRFELMAVAVWVACAFAGWHLGGI
jgi:hypothetical protein